MTGTSDASDGNPKGTELAWQLNPQHSLVKFAASINRSSFEASFGRTISPAGGRHTLPTRLMVGLHYLKSLYNESDETVVSKWVENPYWQHFCGAETFQHEFPCHLTSLVKWRKFIGADGMEALLKEILRTGLWSPKALSGWLWIPPCKRRRLRFPPMHDGMTTFVER